MSLADVAAVIGVSSTAVHTWERGRGEPRGANLGRYVDVLQMFREEAWRAEP